MTAANGSASSPKYTLSQMSHAVDRVIKVLQIDSERLQQHRKNIQKFKVLEDWSALNKEQINAARTVQQLKSNIQEVGNTRKQIRDCDHNLFDKKVHKVKTNAQLAISELLDLHEYHNIPLHSCEGNSTATSIHGDSSGEPTKCSKKEANVWLQDSLPDCHVGGIPLDRMDQQLDLTVHYEDLERERLAEESWENLRQNLEDLNELMQALSKIVHAQQETIDNIEDNIEHATEDVTAGTKYLAQAAKWKSAMFPVVGALIGGVIGGPIGLVAGAKIGGAAGLVGGVAGLASGRMIQKNKSKAIDADMASLDEKTDAEKELTLDDLKKPSKKS